MLRSYLCMLLILGGINTASSQTYHQLPKGDAIWSEIDRHSSFYPYKMHFLKLSAEDTVLGGITYRKVYKSTDTFFTEAEFMGGMREDTLAHRIYGYNLGMCAYSDMLMYDFDVQVGDTLRGIGANNCVNWITDVFVHSIDSTQVDGSYRKKINLRLTGLPNLDILPSAWVEGIGDIIRGLVFPGGTMPNNGMWNELICVNSGLHTLYHNTTDWNIYDGATSYSLFPDCFPELQNITASPHQPDILVFPHPVTYESKLQIPAGINASSLRIYDMNGRLMKEEHPHDRHTLTIHRSDFLTGNYTWQLISENGAVFHGKITVE